MEYASALDDGIGPRLTGSQNLAQANAWTRDQFTAMGCSNAHLEDWGEFGMGWRQLNTWVRMTAPDTAVFIAQAAAVVAVDQWSRERPGRLDGHQGREGSRQVQGQAGGKDRFPRRRCATCRRSTSRCSTPLDDAELKKLTEYPVNPRDREDFLAGTS